MRGLRKGGTHRGLLPHYVANERDREEVSRLEDDNEDAEVADQPEGKVEGGGRKRWKSSGEQSRRGEYVRRSCARPPSTHVSGNCVSTSKPYFCGSEIWGGRSG